MFLTCAIAENKRAPFDCPEGESEIIAGYHLEYSGMRFGLFYMSEFIEIVVIAGLIAALFLGGWSIPYLTQETIIGAIAPLFGDYFATSICMILHVISFFAKVIVMIYIQMAARWSLPRFRYDQIMDLCWKILLPLSVANVLVTGAVMLAIGRFA
jgi:NADH-quinone oxidoreductase subunit H